MRSSSYATLHLFPFPLFASFLSIGLGLRSFQAANYLDIKALLDVGCKTVANMIKGKSPEEIRKTFNIQNDFTPEEEDQIRRENEWAEEYAFQILPSVYPNYDNADVLAVVEFSQSFTYLHRKPGPF